MGVFMKLHNLIDNSYQSFLEQMKHTKVVLFHPRSRYRSMLIAKLISTPDLKVFYYAMGPDDINLQAFLSSIAHDLANQHPTFGRHINILPQNVYENPEENFDVVLETFARDLSEINNDMFLLILDEYDRSDSSDGVQRFVERLGNILPENCRLIINSRTLPRLPWVSMIAQKRAVLLEDGHVIHKDFYGVRNDNDDAMGVYALGPSFVMTDSESVDNWEGHLPRLLFFFALDRPVVTRSEICQAFWPELDSDQAVNVFHVTKRRLHKALNTDVLVHEDGYYRVNPNMLIYYDAVEFVSVLMQGRNSHDVDQCMAAWQRASELYRGPFLQGHNDAWILERRSDFRAGYVEALTEMARVWQERGRYEQALALLQKALAADNSEENLHRQLMQLYAQLGRRSEVVMLYKRLVDVAGRENVAISDELHQLYNSIMN
jgi:DNA-binding SARP family transcriptional activator